MRCSRSRSGTTSPPPSGSSRLGVDMIWLGDDIGQQTGMLFSPKHWRRFLKPRMAELIATLKGINPQLKIAYHTDGAVQAVIPELIEIGIDVLNPVQPAAMDPAQLKREYGRELCFWGSMDEQRTLPFGTPDDVRARGARADRDARRRRRPDSRADPPRPARHAAGELLGDGGGGDRDPAPEVAGGGDGGCVRCRRMRWGVLASRGVGMVRGPWSVVRGPWARGVGPVVRGSGAPERSEAGVRTAETHESAACCDQNA